MNNRLSIEYGTWIQLECAFSYPKVIHWWYVNLTIESLTKLGDRHITVLAPFHVNYSNYWFGNAGSKWMQSHMNREVPYELTDVPCIIMPEGKGVV